MHRAELPSYNGTFFVTPKPPYLSQFVDLYPASIKVDSALTDKKHIESYGAKDSKEFTFWAWRNCGIVCVKMILEANKKAKTKTIMDLTKEGIDLGGYKVYEKGKFVDKGWFHQALIELLNTYGVKAVGKKWQTVESVAKDILENKLVILSVYVPGRSYIQEDGSFLPKKEAKYGGHLLLATGIKMSGRNIEGIYVHDPRGLPKYQKDTFIPKSVFERIFTNRTIVAL